MVHTRRKRGIWLVGKHTKLAVRDVDLNADAMAAITGQRTISAAKGVRVWLNPRNGKPWVTDAQIRKTLWMPLMARSELVNRNPCQVRHTFASALLTSGANPWYVVAQLGHEDVQMVYRTYGKFIRQDYQKPRPELRAVAGS